MSELDRRQFLIRGGFAFLALTGLGWLNAACGGQKPSDIQTQIDPKTPRIPYTVETLQNLGKELNEWRLVSGTLMISRFPEIKKCGDLLSGSLDPAQYFPFIKIPIGFSSLPDKERAALIIQRIPNLNDSRRIVVTTKEGQVLNAPILAMNTPVDMTMSPDILDKSIRMPVLVKEISQLIDYPDYCRAFVNDLVSVYGVNFTLHNPNNIPTSEVEVLISICNNAGLERTLTGRDRFRFLVDNGSFLRSGIAFANWYEDQLNIGLQPEGQLVTTGLRTRDFLKDRGLIKKEGDLFVWSAGENPKINTPNFLELVNAISLRT